MSLPNTYVEVVAPNLTIFGDRDFTEVIKVKLNHMGLATIQENLCPDKKRHYKLCEHTKRQLRMQQEGGHLQSKKNSLRRNQTC